MKNPNRFKKELFEKIVAEMHKYKDVKVTQNVLISNKEEPKYKREFDVMVESHIAGYPVKLLIECKNHEKPIKAPFIDAFKGKLDAVGHPHQYGIFISRNGYTKGALQEAKQFGIRTLTLKGLKEDGLSSFLYDAFQSIVHYLCSISYFAIIPANPKKKSGHHLCPIYDKDERFAGFPADLMWYFWNQKFNAFTISNLRINVDLKGKCFQKNDKGEKIYIKEMVFDCLIKRLVLTLPGKEERHSLEEVESKNVEKIYSKVSFESIKKEHPIVAFETEEDINRYLGNQKGSKLITRVKLNRIDTGACIWPPSKKAIDKMEEIAGPFIRGETQKNPRFTTLDVEGETLNAYFEPIDKEWLEGFKKRKYTIENIVVKGMT